MNKKIMSVTSILAALALIIGLVAPAMAATTTAENVRTMLLNALHEERVAAATYQAIIDEFGKVEPFTNILKAEEQHIAAVENLLKVNGIKIPANNVAATAPKTLEESYTLAINVEKEDIALYEEMYPNLSDTMIKTVFTRLSNASQRHLQAFETYANGQTPQGKYMVRKGRKSGSQIGMNNVQGRNQGKMYRQRDEMQNGNCNPQNGRNTPQGNRSGQRGRNNQGRK